MGLSASQARLIALTARMSDVEYEGQQINQQRLALSNKMSDIYSQMEGMVVPTPPSPYDHMTTNLTGSTGSGNNKQDVGITQNPDGTFTVSVPVQGDTLARTGNNGALGTTYTFEEAKDIPQPSNSITAKYKKEVPKTGYTNGTDRITEKDYAAKVAEYNSMDAGAADGTDEQKAKFQAKKEAQSKLQAYQQFTYYELEENATGEATATEGASANAPANYSHVHGLNPEENAQPSSITYEYQNCKGETKKTGAEEFKAASSGYSSSQITQLISQNYFTDEKGTELTADSFDANGKLPENTKIYTRTEVDSLGSGKAMTHAEAKEQLANHSDPKIASKWGDIEQRLINYVKGMGAASSVTEEQLSKFRFTFDGATINVYEANNDGSYNKLDTNATDEITKDYEGGEGAFSASGNLKGVTYKDENGKTQNVKASSEESLDQVSYGAAMAKYEAEKAEYDQEQKRLNNETSKIQLEDKKLDLKLKRLDTERNALNTEIDAVKKVIQDAVDHGFKTFSG